MAHGVPDLRVRRLPERFAWLLEHQLPLERNEHRRLGAAVARFAGWCHELAAAGVADTVQHDDLHMYNLYRQEGRFRFLDWGDSSISHPFMSLIETFRFLEESNGLDPSDPWFARLRDAYLEPWGAGLQPLCDLALRVGAVTHAIAWVRQRDALPEAAVDEFDEAYVGVLRRALALLSA